MNMKFEKCFCYKDTSIAVEVYEDTEESDENLKRLADSRHQFDVNTEVHKSLTRNHKL